MCLWKQKVSQCKTQWMCIVNTYGKAAGFKRLSKCVALALEMKRCPQSLFLQKKTNRGESADRDGDFVVKSSGFPVE